MMTLKFVTEKLNERIKCNCMICSKCFERANLYFSFECIILWISYPLYISKVFIIKGSFIEDYIYRNLMISYWNFRTIFTRHNKDKRIITLLFQELCDNENNFSLENRSKLSTFYLKILDKSSVFSFKNLNKKVRKFGSSMFLTLKSLTNWVIFT